MRESARNLLAVLCIVAAACSRENAARDTASGGTSGTQARHRRPESYVGIDYDPLPPGVMLRKRHRSLGKDGLPSRFVLSHVSTPRGLMVWLDSLTPADAGAGARRRIVRAVMDDPKHAPGERLMIGTCDVKGKLDGAIVAVVQDAPAAEIHQRAARVAREPDHHALRQHLDGGHRL